MRLRRKHILKAEVTENGAIYKEKSVDIYVVSLILLFIFLGVTCGLVFVIDCVSILVKNGVFPS